MLSSFLLILLFNIFNIFNFLLILVLNFSLVLQLLFQLAAKVTNWSLSCNIYSLFYFTFISVTKIVKLLAVKAIPDCTATNWSSSISLIHNSAHLASKLFYDILKERKRILPKNEYGYNRKRVSCSMIDICLCAGIQLYVCDQHNAKQIMNHVKCWCVFYVASDWFHLHVTRSMSACSRYYGFPYGLEQVINQNENHIN